jgi:hypothetical protein
LATPAMAGTPAPTTTSPTTTPPPACDCDHPEPTGAQTGCLSFGCPPTVYLCPIIEPCDSVGVGCGVEGFSCGWTFTADCASVPGVASGTVTSIVEIGGPVCDPLVGIHVGDHVAFEYQIT